MYMSNPEIKAQFKKYFLDNPNETSVQTTQGDYQYFGELKDNKLIIRRQKVNETVTRMSRTATNNGRSVRESAKRSARQSAHESARQSVHESARQSAHESRKSPINNNSEHSMLSETRSEEKYNNSDLLIKEQSGGGTIEERLERIEGFLLKIMSKLN